MQTAPLAFQRLPLKGMEWNPRPTLSFQVSRSVSWCGGGGGGVVVLQPCPPPLGFVKIHSSSPGCGQTQEHILPTSVTQHLSFCYIHMSPEEKVNT